MKARQNIENTKTKYRKWLLTIVFYFAAATALYLLTRLRYESGQRQFSLKAYVISAVLVVGTGILHQKSKGRQSIGEYIKTLVVGPDVKGNRIVYMDYLRVLATVLVIGVHIIEPLYQQMESHTFSWTILAVTASIFHGSNLLFIMISGALLLNRKEESIWNFYKKRFLKVAVPCFAYYCFYYFYFYGTGAFMPDKILDLIRSFTANSSGITPHFWLIHVILVFYLAAPFFSIMLKAMTESQVTALAAVIFILHCIYTYGPFGQINFVLTTFLASWESIFILGYFCTTKAVMKYYRLILAGGGISLLFTVFAVEKVENFSGLLYNNAPTMILIAGSVFLFFRKHGETLFSKTSLALQIAGKYSFSILMIHWYILFEVVEKHLGINGSSFGILGGILLSAAATFSLSAGFAFLYDNTVVVCADGAVNWVLNILDRKKKAL